MRAKLVAANWKMNGSFSLLDKMLDVLRPNMGNTSCQVVICPPHVLLSSLNNAVEGTGIEVGAQMFIVNYQEHSLEKHPQYY